MSKNIVIQEGGEGRQFTAAKLKTALVGGGSCLWIPEDEANLGTKSITEDGTYPASGDGLYGYSSVTVRGIGKVTGKDPVTGEETQVTAETNPQTGEKEIKTKVIPSSIRITTPPARLVYNEGDLIDMYPGGMVVKAFLKNGSVFTDETYPDGIIPDTELDKPVQVAHADGSGGGGDDPRIRRLNNPGDYICHIQTGGGSALRLNRTFTKTMSGEAYAAVVKNRNGYDQPFIVGKTRESVCMHCEDTTSPVDTRDWTPEQTSGIMVDGEQYYIIFSWGIRDNIGDQPIATLSDVFTEADAVRLIWGGNTSDKQNIPVNWLCPYGDNKTLTDHFTITVNPAPEPEPNAEPETDPEDDETP